MDFISFMNKLSSSSKGVSMDDLGVVLEETLRGSDCGFFRIVDARGECFNFVFGEFKVNIESLEGHI